MPMDVAKTKKFKFEIIQIFRGIAALVVVLHHISAANSFYFHSVTLNDIFSVGWSGVDFFFVLSGFIITYAHAKDMGHVKKVKPYLLKRAIRIYPTYWIFALLAICFYLKVNHYSIRETTYLMKSFFLINQNQEPVLRVAWSLIYEVSFYVLFAVYILLGFKWFVAGLMVHILLILTNVVAPSFLMGIPVIGFLSTNYNLLFVFGCITGLFVVKFSIENIKKYKALLWIGGTIGFLFSWKLSLTTVVFSKFSFNSRLLYGLSSCCLIIGAICFRKFNRSQFFTFWLRLGDASYVLYLCHILIIAFLYKIYSAFSANHVFLKSLSFLYSFNLIVLLVCVIAALMFYSLIDKRITYKLNSVFVNKLNWL